MPVFRLLRSSNRHDSEKSPNGLIAPGPFPAAFPPRRLLLFLFLLPIFAIAVIALLHFISATPPPTPQSMDTPSTTTATKTPVNTPQQLNSRGKKFWLSGSWGYILQAPKDCWPHPRFDSFAIACPLLRKETLPMVVTMEIMSLLTVKQVQCKSCTTQSSPKMDTETKFILNRTRRGRSGSRSVRLLEVILPPFSVSCQSEKNYQKNEWGFDTNGLNTSSCMIRFDLLVSLKKRLGLSPRPIPPICFAAIGDWGAPKPDQSMVIRQLKLLMRQYWVKFIVSTGDNFYPAGVRSLTDAQWADTFERPFSHKAFKRVPFLISAGNHDLLGKLSVLVEYSKTNPMWFFPAPYFGITIPLIKSCTETSDLKNKKDEGTEEDSSSCTADVMDVFVMNSYEDKTWDHQIKSGNDFFDARPFNDPKRHRWRLVLNHEALLSGSMHGVKMARNQVFRNRILPFISKHKIHAYLNGDDHLLEIHHLNGTDFITSGSGGGSTCYQSFERLSTTVWRPEIKRGMRGEGNRFVLGPTLHCTVPFSDSLTTTLYNVSAIHEEEVYIHDTIYDRK
ncbi:putative tartrate-resistant acid phosphatase type 5 [Trypanosoma theileri]|uniref:Putative tartrate-resistant acid phosphatase type 5 n=1 Tax=Trypanosoma theileri TaxID=67003 RepID=A0A1X0P1M9_9TRYP|nr:putative tartrate-resistant acid phosphatase type 5 [Trypanosoma theileri]ORC90310.1 putative tartrate-resistant acid phosphatase type 5 [Trypanosoma theileri]